jgi:transcriptional regulator with XRE-family HTH domain
MSLKASGAYLQHLREHTGLSRAELAEKLSTSPSQVFRIEEGKGETRGSLLAAFIRNVNGSAEDVVNLLLNSRASAEEGVRAAEIWLGSQQPTHIYRSTVHPDVADLAGRLSDYELGRWVAFGQRLLDERSK